jgi:hypothetical protein
MVVLLVAKHIRHQDTKTQKGTVTEGSLCVLVPLWQFVLACPG